MDDRFLDLLREEPPPRLVAAIAGRWVEGPLVEKARHYRKLGVRGRSVALLAAIAFAVAACGYVVREVVRRIGELSVIEMDRVPLPPPEATSPQAKAEATANMQSVDGLPFPPPTPAWVPEGFEPWAQTRVFDLGAGRYDATLGWSRPPGHVILLRILHDPTGSGVAHGVPAGSTEEVHYDGHVGVLQRGQWSSESWPDESTRTAPHFDPDDGKVLYWREGVDDLVLHVGNDISDAELLRMWASFWGSH